MCLEIKSQVISLDFSKTESQNDKMNSDVISPLAIQGDVRNYYDFVHEIGKGSFSVVYKAIHKETKEEYAIKIMKKKEIKKQQLIAREIEIMTTIHHEHILWCKEVYENDNEIVLVLELVNGGELYDSIVEMDRYSEVEAKKIIRQLVSAVEYLHSKGIAHRDLKPENILIEESADGNRKIKVADFGLSKMFSLEDLISRCGSITYIAPEVIACETYSEAVDMWAIGVITFVLLTGCYPFFIEEGKHNSELFQKILNVNFSFPHDVELSDDAKHFIKVLLERDPMKRYAPSQCKKHPWLLN